MLFFRSSKEMRFHMDYTKEKDFLLLHMHRAFAGYGKNPPAEVQQKSQFDLVTEIDVRIEAYLTDAIKQAFPQDHIHGEEMSGNQEITGRTWTIDPIDGTCNMARGIPMYGIQCALFDGGQVVLGAIFLPFSGQTLYAIKGQGCYCNDRPVRVSQNTPLNHAIVSFGDYSHKDDALAELQHIAIRRIYPHVAKLRMYGAACLDFSFVACGKTDATAVLTRNIWDLAPGVLLCQEAGGIVVNLRGEPYRPGDPGVIACSTRQLADLMIRSFTR